MNGVYTAAGGLSMIYRTLGRTGIRVGEIGMGLEHLLCEGQDTVTATIQAAVEGGVTYFDCHPAHDYDGRPESEHYKGYVKLGNALASVDRSKLILSHISPVQDLSLPKSKTVFENYLAALGTDYADVFILQFCDTAAHYDHAVGEGGLLAYAKRLRDEGKVRFIGLSTHSTDIALNAIHSGEFDVLMFPVNPAFDVLTDGQKYDTENLGSLWDAAYDFNAEGHTGNPRKDVYTACERHGIGLVAMKPFAGGFIFGVEEAAGFTALNLTAYALAQTGVSVVVPGCTNPEQIREILTYHTCTDERLDYSGAVSKSRWSVMGHCIYCHHCLPCPQGIIVGQVNRFLDSGARDAYAALPIKASACTGCGICQGRCPFKVNVAERMKQAVVAFETNQL